ncbi:MAG: hypothetical protein IIC13_01055 [SAR324 cluster bacterium]|nr:hypothetical protein [SAR324 cluster bacterium]
MNNDTVNNDTVNNDTVNNDTVKNRDGRSAASRETPQRDAGDKLELRAWLRLLGVVNRVEGALRGRLRQAFDSPLPDHSHSSLLVLADCRVGPQDKTLGPTLQSGSGAATHVSSDSGRR